MRLFVSIDLPDELADAIATIQDDLDDAAGVRVTDPTQAHVTIKFLGEVDAGRVDDVTDGLRDAVETTDVDPFTAHIAGLGVFPDLSYISVVWLGVEAGGEAMTTLHEAVEAELVDRGFEPESHDFTPHVTIARMDHAGGKEHVQQVVSDRAPTVGDMEVTSLALTESTLTDDGPVYETVERVGLEA